MSKYYHIFVRTKDDENRNIYDIKTWEVDKTNLSLIKKKIIRPYINERGYIIVNGYKIPINKVKQLKIKESTITSDEYRSYLEIDDPNPFGLYQNRDILYDENKFTKDITEELIDEIEGELQEQNISTISIPTTEQVLDKSKVFIVHGHDDAVKLEVAEFIKTLDLNPIILHQQANNGKTIIEKIEEHSDVGFGIVLYTPCDVGSTKDNKKELKARARQNVVFEHGFLIGKIGRANVCALVSSPQIELPNDISGMVYTQMSGNWKIELAKELKGSGYSTPKIDTLAEL